NKVWTYAKLIELGADAYWIKEGLDEKYDVNDSKRNYLNFRSLLNNIDGGHYKFLKELDFARKVINNIEYHWWQKVKWQNGNQTQCEKKTIMYLLKVIVMKIKIFLQRSELGIGFNSSMIKSLEACSIINNVGSIVEILHFSGIISDSKILQSSYKDKGNNELEGRNDYISFLVSRYRNLASHKSCQSCNNFMYIMQPIKLMLHLLTRQNHQDFKYPTITIPSNNSWEKLSEAYSTLIKFNNIDEKHIWE
ncbi:MAG: hypothetical protein M1480_05580, partial [Bacteroidetes bacterium]|nr:hypothetical protein [Bacteroidota bacterium]